MRTSSLQTNAALVLKVGSYYFAKLIGFAASELRVKLNRIEGDYVWVTTADLLDAGTPLTLDASRIVEVAE